MNPNRARSLEDVTPRQRAIITFVVMISTLMQLLDTTIVNVALPHMKGQLSATPEQISWVLTSYVVASSILMPLTGFFSDRIGTRNFLLITIAGFTIASALCGLATTLTQIVLFRILQGVFGAALVPLSQVILLRIYPPEERGRAMALWGVGIMAGPILGPTVGGWLTERWSWHWTFFINVPIGALLLVLALITMPSSSSRARRMDWSGFALMAVAVASLQLILDLGHRQSWFDSDLIRNLAVICLVSLGGFIWHGLHRNEDPIFDLHIFKDRNFIAGLLIITTMTLGFYGATLLMPLMMVGSLGFNAFTTGLILAPRGVATIFSTLLAGRLVSYYDGRTVVGAGIILLILGNYVMTLFNLSTPPSLIITAGVIQGLGMGLVFVPISAMAYTSLESRLVSEATGVFGLVRSVGGSIGIAVISAFTARHAQLAWGQLRGGVQESSTVLRDWLDSAGLDRNAPETWRIVGMELEKQSQMVAYVDGFQLVFLITLAMMPLLLLFKGRQLGPSRGETRQNAGTAEAA